MGEKPSPKHSIDRIDNEKGYEKSNCRWATSKEQCSNTRRTIFVTIDDRKVCLKDACEFYGLSYSTALDRKKRGVKIFKNN